MTQSSQQSAGRGQRLELSEQTPGDRRPVSIDTGNAIQPMAQPGYYQGFSTLDQRAFWDETTRDLIERRINEVPPIRFFRDGGELELVTAVIDRVLPQDDRDEQLKIPIVNYVDERLYGGTIDGYRYADMPPDDQAIRLGLQGIDAVASNMYAKRFVDLEPIQQDEVLWTIHRDQPQGGEEIWQRVPADRFWILLLSEVADAYYAHPYAWDEVGFGGPAYPRGYFRVENGRAEPWEVDEQRYEWRGPPTSSSDHYEPLGGRHPHSAPGGQTGTH